MQAVFLSSFIEWNHLERFNHARIQKQKESSHDVHGVTEDVRFASTLRLKERGQPFRKELPDTIKSRFDSFWRASQNLADLSVRKIVVRK